MENIDFDRLFLKIFDSMSAKISDIGLITAGIVGIGALFYFANKVWGSLARNESIDFYPLLRPCVIIFLCLNFQSIVVTPMHYILSPLRTYTAKIVKTSQNDTKDRINTLIKEAKTKRGEDLKKVREHVGKKGAGFWKKNLTFSLSIGQEINNIFDQLKEWLLELILSILSLLKSAIYIIMNFLRLFFLIILGMIGPIAFALSLFPSFENSLSNWFAKYISIYLWAPICNIISVLLSQGELVMMESLFGNGSDSIMLFVMMIVFYIIGAYSYLSIPTIATWVVQGGASALELSQMLQGTRKAGLVAGAAAAAYYGKAGSNIKNGLKGAWETLKSKK